MKPAFLLKSFIVGSCIIHASVQAVERPWYEIEVIVFEQSSKERLDSEIWNPQVSLPDITKSIDFLTPDPSDVKIEQLCLHGKMQPVLGIVPTSIVIEESANEIVDAAIPDALMAANEPEMTTEPETELVQEEEIPFVILDKELNQLNDLRSTLARRKGFRPLLHVSWRQPVENRKHSQLVRLFSGNNYSETFNPEGDARVNIASMVDGDEQNNQENINPFNINNPTTYNEQYSPLGGDADEETPFNVNSSNLLPFDDSVLLTAADYRRSVKQQLSQCQKIFQQQADGKYPDVWQLDGNIRIYVKRYLHLETDLFLRIPGKEELELGAIETSLAADKLLDSLQANNLNDNDDLGWKLDEDFLSQDPSMSTVIQEVLNKYPMQQSRRIRSKEIHYIDHPLFGLLIQIRPYKKLKTNDNV